MELKIWFLIHSSRRWSVQQPSVGGGRHAGPHSSVSSRGYTVYAAVSYSHGTPRTVARQAPLSMGFSRQEYWSGLPCPPPGNPPDPGIEPGVSCIAGRFFTAEPPGKPCMVYTFVKTHRMTLLKPLCKLYLKNSLVNDMPDEIFRGEIC